MAAAPVIVFAYKRPQLLEATLRSLAANDLASTSQLHIYCDGPKADASAADRASIQAVREIAHSAAGFAGVRVIAAERNKGLARSVIDGVSEVLRQHDRVIVVEDDVALSPFFLRFMNDALDRHATNERGSAGRTPSRSPRETTSRRICCRRSRRNWTRPPAATARSPSRPRGARLARDWSRSPTPRRPSRCRGPRRTCATCSGSRAR